MIGFASNFYYGHEGENVTICLETEHVFMGITAT